LTIERELTSREQKFSVPLKAFRRAIKALWPSRISLLMSFHLFLLVWCLEQLSVAQMFEARAGILPGVFFSAPPIFAHRIKIDYQVPAGEGRKKRLIECNI
jgi:hypothetical protein